MTLATRNVSLKSISTIGKTKEHLRLTIEDEGGNVQSILWWGGAGEEKPEEGGKFDISYSLRASSYRGQKQVTVQFEEFRIVEEKPVEVRKSKIEIRDMRMGQPACWHLQNKLPHSKFGPRARRNQKGNLVSSCTLLMNLRSIQLPHRRLNCEGRWRSLSQKQFRCLLFRLPRKNQTSILIVWRACANIRSIIMKEERRLASSRQPWLHARAPLNLVCNGLPPADMHL
ncbi:MAG: hypothetical protein IPN96_12005 [Anaerolineales bacterium]|nr:hypothetical protein [Anaerolineales bacterium]